MILSDNSILQNIENGNIVISPFDRSCLGSNSYDVHLSENFAVYRTVLLDAKQENDLHHFKIPESGYTLEPNTLYLSTTSEYTETHNLVPFLEGKSSTGRLGIDIHATAGKGDAGFKGYWTLEISVKQPVIVYPNMPIGQLIFFPIFGEVDVPYNAKPSAKYNNCSPLPQGSKMWKNFGK